jgi:hypothetical protein
VCACARTRQTDEEAQDKRRFILPRIRHSLVPLLEAVGLWDNTLLLKHIVWTTETRNVDWSWLAGNIRSPAYSNMLCYFCVRFARDVQGVMTLASYLRCCLSRLYNYVIIISFVFSEICTSDLKSCYKCNLLFHITLFTEEFAYV